MRNPPRVGLRGDAGITATSGAATSSGICRLQISVQIPWMYVRVCILVPLTVHERSDHCEAAHAKAQT